MRGKCTSSSRCRSGTTPVSRRGKSAGWPSQVNDVTHQPHLRYFEGVQGDKHKQGELFGIQNIFKLHEHTLATKMAVRFQGRNYTLAKDAHRPLDRARPCQ